MFSHKHKQPTSTRVTALSGGNIRASLDSNNDWAEKNGNEEKNIEEKEEKEITNSSSKKTTTTTM